MMPLEKFKDHKLMTERPLSPHLQIYRWTLTMAMPIIHRATGMALAVGLLMVVWMLLAAASGEAAFSAFQSFNASLLGQLMLFGWTVSLFYHMGNGIRHLVWDMGKGYELPNAYRSGYAVLLFTAAMTAIVWCPAILG
jgi:succinate dehydrogenase / fumarate reductase cytochrome b subunit